MKKSIKMILILLATTFLALASYAADYPQNPETSITTGKLCEKSQVTRYPEKIPYCERDVSWQTKEILMKEYDQKFNYHIMKLPRSDIKIDHFIPLCAGGSNDISNLWPQHKTVFAISDPLEPVICEKMAVGRLKQKEAISLIIEAKMNLDRTSKILQYVNGL